MSFVVVVEYPCRTHCIACTSRLCLGPKTAMPFRWLHGMIIMWQSCHGSAFALIKRTFDCGQLVQQALSFFSHNGKLGFVFLEDLLCLLWISKEPLLSGGIVSNRCRFKVDGWLDCKDWDLKRVAASSLLEWDYVARKVIYHGLYWSRLGVMGPLLFGPL